MSRAMLGQPKAARKTTTYVDQPTSPDGTCSDCVRKAYIGADSASSIRVEGNDSVRSIARPMRPSTQPRVKPAMMPSTVPITIASVLASSESVSDSVVPSQTRDSTSRPVPGSTPSGWLQLTPPSLPLGRVNSFSRCWLKLYGSSTPKCTRNGAEIAATKYSTTTTSDTIESLS